MYIHTLTHTITLKFKVNVNNQLHENRFSEVKSYLLRNATDDMKMILSREARII
jgi:hypothetical protein